MQTGQLLWNWLPLLLQGAALTMQLWISIAVISVILGTLFGIVLSSRVWIPFVSWTVAGLTFVVRAVPFYVQLLITYFVLPELIGINISAFTAGVISLGLCSSGYVSQIVCAGINAIPAGQWEASYTLGFSRGTTLIHIIIPQMMRTVLPALVNELDAVLKSTSIISSIGVLELTRMGMNIVSREMNPLPIYGGVALIYLLLSSVILLAARIIERKIRYQ